jgi:hypothetical protein
MEIKKLYRLTYDDRVYSYREYKVWCNDGLYSVETMDGTEGDYNMPQSLFERCYGEDLTLLFSNRVAWLKEIVLPQRIISLSEVNNEIKIYQEQIKKSLIKE